MTQAEFDFGGKKRRNHHRTTILTTDRRTFERVRTLRPGDELRCSACNDIISSARCSSENEHHMIRRVSLVRRQMAGNYTAVKVRTEADELLRCKLISVGNEPEDACAFTVVITRENA